MNAMIFRRRLGPKGQVVIPKDVREHLHLKEGSNVVFEVGRDAAVMRAEADAETWLKEYLSVVKEKSRKKVDVERILEEEAEEEIALPRQ